MLINKIESQLRRYTGVNTTQYSQADFLEDINIVKDEFWSGLVSNTDEDSDYEIWNVTPEAITTNSEYTMPEVAYNLAGIKMLKGISISYQGETFETTGLTDYTKAREVNPETLPYEWNYYVENQSADDPIYYIADNSYFIAPSIRTEYVSLAKIKLKGIRKIADYDITTTELQMKIPVDYHRVLLLGTIPYALRSKRVEASEVITADNQYEVAKRTAYKNMANRKEGPITMEYPEPINDEIIFN